MKEAYLSLANLHHEVEKLISDLAVQNHRNKSHIWQASIVRSALIVTDMQNYFLSPDSHAFIPPATAIIPNIQTLADFFRKNHRPVIFTKHINTSENAASMGYWWKDLVQDETPSAEIIENLILPGDIILTKNQYDAFHETDLEEILKKNNVLYPVICGVMTNLCCETTTRTAFVKGFQPVLPVDATAAYNREFHIATFRNLSFGFCPLMTTNEVLDRLES